MPLYTPIGSEEGLVECFSTINTVLGHTVLFTQDNKIKVNYGLLVGDSDIIFTLDKAMFLDRLSIEIQSVNNVSFFISCKSNGRNTFSNRYFIGIRPGSNPAAVYSSELTALLPVTITLLPVFLEYYLQ